MTSKNSFFLSMKENIRRRGAVLAAFAVYFFFAFPVATALKINNYIYQGQTPDSSVYHRLYEDLQSILGINSFTTFFVVILAVLCGVQAFSWLHHRSRVDLYHSLPVSKNRRFAVIYLNGILAFALMYLTALILSGLICSVMWKIPDAAMVKSMAAAYALFMLLFVCIYNLSIVSVMLTGNTVMTCFAIPILLFYECLIRFMFFGFARVFFDTYWNPNTVYGGLFSPLNNFLDQCGLSLNQNTMPHAFSRPALLMYAYLILTLVLAWLLYHLRPSEGCGRALAFARLRPFLKCFLLIPFALSSSFVFHAFTNGSFAFLVFGLVIGLLLGHGILEILFDFDLQSALRHGKSLLVCAAASILILSAYLFDLFGYDRFVPDREQLVSAAWVPDTDSQYVYRYGNSSLPLAHDPYQTMRLTDQDAILELAGMSINDLPARQMLSEDQLIRSHIVYTLRSGRKVYRTLWTDYSKARTALNRLYTSEEYKKAVFPLYQEDKLEHFYNSQPVILYINNLKDSDSGISITSRYDIRELLDAYRADYDTLDFSRSFTGVPCGYIRLNTLDPDSSDTHEWSFDQYFYTGLAFPVYPEFQNTLDWFKAHDIVAYLAFEPDRIAKLCIEGYNVEASGEYRLIRTDVTDPEQIASMKDLVQPGPGGQNFYTTSHYTDITVTAFFKESTETKSAVFCFNNQESVPEFVRAAVTVSK